MNTNHIIRARFEFPEQYTVEFVTYTNCFNQQANEILIRSADTDTVLTDWDVSKDVGNRIYLDIKHAIGGEREEDVIDWIEWTLDDNRDCHYHPFSWMPKRGFGIRITAGSVKHDWMSGLTYKAARDICTQNGWTWVDENEFAWNMEIVEQA